MGPTDCRSPSMHQIAFQGNFPNCKVLWRHKRNSWATRHWIKPNIVAWTHPVLISKPSNDLQSAPCHWRTYLVHLYNVQVHFIPANPASVYSILYDIYLFTYAVTKLINLLSAINRKQNGLHCVVLSWHSIKTVWLSAFRGTHDLCLKNLINIATYIC